MKKILLTFIFLTSLTFGQSDLLLLFDDADSVDSPTTILAVGDVAKITLSWTNAATYDSVKIYRGTSTDPTTLVYTLAGNSISKVDTPLTEGTLYYYRVKGKIGDNLSSYSSNASDTVKYFVYAIDLSGTTEYLSDASPVSLDLNGSELVTAQTDRDFETTIGNWVAVGSAIPAQSAMQKHAGTYSAQVTTVGSYSGAQLPYANFTTSINGEDYTFEAWIYVSSADTVNFVIGDKSIKRNILATTWTKFVYNFQATGSTVSQNIQILFKTTGLTNYVDDVSLSRSYDYMVSGWFKFNAIETGDNRILYYSAAGGYSNWSFYESANKVKFTISDVATGITVTSSSSLSNNIWFYLTGTFDRAGNATLYVNGISNGTPQSITGVGKNHIAQTLGVGTARPVAAQDLNGFVGSVQIVRFDSLPVDIATLVLNNYNAGGVLQPSYSGGTIVAWYTWAGDATTFDDDKSGTGNNLTGTNVDITDVVAYPAGEY